MDREDALRRLERLCAKSGYTAGERDEIESLSREILHKGVRRCDCPDRWRDAAMECRHALRSRKKNGKTMAKTSYFLKKGTVIFWQDKVYTNANLTDDVAKAFLAKFPKAATRFEIIPQADTAPVAEDVKPVEADTASAGVETADETPAVEETAEAAPESTPETTPEEETAPEEEIQEEEQKEAAKKTSKKS